MPAAPDADADAAPEATPPPLGYAAAPAGRSARVLRRIRPGTAGFFLLVALLAGAAAWGAWKGMLYRDRRAFDACATSIGVKAIRFTHAPTRGALRHAARLPGGPWELYLDWPATEGLGASAAIGTVKTTFILVGPDADADALLVELARPDGKPKPLTQLYLINSRVTDAGLAALARPDSGLGALSMLVLGGSPVTDAGLTALARRDTGLKALTHLNLMGTSVTDAGLIALVAPSSGLKALTGLSLDGTSVTDAGLTALARPGSGLKALTGLSLDGTSVTDGGLIALARPDSGLAALHSLHLRRTRVTDAGLLELARPDSGLNALRVLFLDRTFVTDAGVKTLQQARRMRVILR